MKIDAQKIFEGSKLILDASLLDARTLAAHSTKC
jgi:hypothetical protein